MASVLFRYRFFPPLGALCHRGLGLGPARLALRGAGSVLLFCGVPPVKAFLSGIAGGFPSALGGAPALPLGGGGTAVLAALRPVGLSLAGADEAVLAVANEILSARLVEGLQHQSTVLRLAPLHESPLEGLVMGVLGQTPASWSGVQTGVPHAGGQGPGVG